MVERKHGLNREPLDGSSLVASRPEFSEGLKGAPVCGAPGAAVLPELQAWKWGSEGVRRSRSSC